MKRTLLIFAAALMLMSCKKEVPGCTDVTADNYSYDATTNDGSCTYSGSLMFWINSPKNYVNVNVEGVVKTITMYYPNGVGACGSDGCATFTLPPGTYSFFAQEQGTANYWSDDLVVTANACNSYVLF